ncbi:hypothetical protein SAMN03097699_1830 [Flavobacteriaceae bacterium MAR_2010_188]|nr:hypothetical protein SAMN03097699_1830 [Flavobacteriaceae bacterium MAR_2010_188]
MKYDGLINDIEGEFNNHQTRGNLLLSQINEIMDPQIHHDLSKQMLIALDTMSKQTIENYYSIKTVTLENKRKEINEMLNMAIVQQRNLRFNNTRLVQTKELAKGLINDLKKSTTWIVNREARTHNRGFAKMGPDGTRVSTFCFSI